MQDYELVFEPEDVRLVGTFAFQAADAVQQFAEKIATEIETTANLRRAYFLKKGRAKSRRQAARYTKAGHEIAVALGIAAQIRDAAGLPTEHEETT